MKYLLLGIIGTAILYELAAQLSGYYSRTSDNLHEEARRNRVRILNQTGQVPSEIHY